MDAPLPDKLYYKIGEISKALALNPSVLRFWETEFGQLRPRKSSSGQRLYSKDDVDLLQTIKRLLYRDKLTIEGARRVISGQSAPRPPEPAVSEPPPVSLALLQEIKEELRFCRKMLE